jgi:hypothetical protein
MGIKFSAGCCASKLAELSPIISIATPKTPVPLAIRLNRFNTSDFFRPAIFNHPAFPSLIRKTEDIRRAPGGPQILSCPA